MKGATRNSFIPAVLPRTAAAVGAGIVAVIVVPAPPVEVAWSCAGIVVLACTVDVLLAPKPTRFRITRMMPRSIGAREGAEVSWTVSNPVDRKVHIAFADDIAPSLRPDRRRVELAVPARGSSAARTAVRPSRRGLFTLAGITIRVPGPLGLIARQGYVATSSELRVYPSFGSRKRAELWYHKNRTTDAGLRSTRYRGGGTDFDSLREYTVDDEYRHIDWSASARAAKSIVRTYRAEIDQRVVCVLDAGRTMAGRVGGLPRFEHALDALLMLVAVSARVGDRAGLVVFDEKIRSVVPPTRMSGQLGRVSEAVYRVEPSLVESDYRGAFSFILSRFTHRSMLVIFSELVESAVAESLLPALSLVARDHAVIVAAVSDPKIGEWAHESPQSVPDAYRKAAALATLETRRATVARLSSLGVTVVDRTPEDLPMALADAYARAKSTGRV